MSFVQVMGMLCACIAFTFLICAGGIAMAMLADWAVERKMHYGNGKHNRKRRKND